MTTIDPFQFRPTNLEDQQKWPHLYDGAGVPWSMEHAEALWRKTRVLEDLVASLTSDNPREEQAIADLRDAIVRALAPELIPIIIRVAGALRS